MNDEDFKSPQFNSKQKNKEKSPSSLMNNQQFIFNQDNFVNQTHFSQNTFNDFPNNGSPEIQEQILESFGNDYLDKNQGRIDMSYSIDEQQSSLYKSKEGNLMQNKDNIISPQKVIDWNQNYLINESYRWEVPTKPKIIQQDECININNSRFQTDKKVAAKSVILGQDSLHNDYINIISRSNDQKRQNQLQSLQKSNQNSQMQGNDHQIIENQTKQQIINSQDVENRNLYSNISFYEELQNDQHFIGNISEYSVFFTNNNSQQQKTSNFNSSSQTPIDKLPYQCIYTQTAEINKKQTHIQDGSVNYQNSYQSFLDNNLSNNNYIDQNISNYNSNSNFIIQNNSYLNCNYFEPNYPNQKEEMFQNFISNQYQFNIGYPQKQNFDLQQNGLAINSNYGQMKENFGQRILEDNDENEDELIEDKLIQDKNRRQQVNPQSSSGFIKGDNQNHQRKQSGYSSKSRRFKKCIVGQQGKSSNSIQNYINSENTKETITDYFKHSNQQINDQLPTFDKYFNSFQSLYNKNIKRKMKISIQRKSYDLAAQSRGFSSYHFKDDNQQIIQRLSSDFTSQPSNPRSVLHIQNKFTNCDKLNENSISRQYEDQFHIQNPSVQKQKQSLHQQQICLIPQTVQTVEGQHKLRSDSQNRNASLNMKSVQERLTPCSINTKQADTHNAIKGLNEQLSSIKKVRQTKSLNKRFKCLTEFSEQDISMTNTPSTTNNNYAQQRNHENIRDTDKLNTIMIDDSKNQLMVPQQLDEGQRELWQKQKKREFKVKLHDIDLNNKMINIDFNLQNSLSNYVNQKITLPKNNKIKNISHYSHSKQTNNQNSSQKVGTIQYNSELQTQLLSTKDQNSSSNVSGYQNFSAYDKINSKDISNITTMQFTNGYSTNATSTAKQTFQSPKKQIYHEQGNNQIIQENNVEYKINSSEIKERKKVLTLNNFNKTPHQLDIPNISTSYYSKTPSSKVSNKMKDATNIYLNKQPEPIECFEKSKLQLQKRKIKTPTRPKVFQNENIFKNYKNQNSPENLLNNITEMSNKYQDQLKNISLNNTPINTNIADDVGSFFKLQRNLEKLYIDQNFQHRKYKQKLRTQSEGRKRQQNQRVKTEQYQ